MKKNLFFISIFLFYLTLSACGNSFRKDRFNLNFYYSDSVDFVWYSASVRPPRIDSAEFVHSKYPICFEAKKLYNLPDPLNVWYLRTTLSQQFVIPNCLFDGKDYEFSIHNKCIGLDSLLLKISGVDKYGNIVKTDTLDINNKGKWERKSLKIHFDSIEYFTISLLGSGMLSPNTINKEIPRLYLDKISITIDGKDINQIDEINNFAIRQKENLKTENIYPICSFDIDAKDILKDLRLDKKKIIAVGETVHGSSNSNETAFQMAKKAILYNNCKQVLTELELSSSLKLNLFLQGKLPESEISNIREELHNSHLSMPVLIDFLLWLREYNKTVKRQVVVLGLVDTYDFLESPLYDYIFSFYDKENEGILLPLLSNLHKKELKEAFTLITNNTKRMQQILGKDDFFFFYHTLENLVAIETGKKHFTIDTYDYHMWLNTNAFISNYLQEGETAFIYTHYGHVKKKEGKLEDPTIPTMGVYLNNCYKNNYSVIGITIGAGTITTREQFSSKLSTYNIEEAGYGSFERICMHQKDTCFYYPSNKLSYDIYSIRHIGNKPSLHIKNEVYSCIKANTDGVIFIQKSYSFKDNYPYEEDYFWNKGLKRAAFLKEAKKEEI